MPDRDPKVRIAATRDTLAFIDKRYPGTRQRILQRFPESSRSAWEGASRLGWLPIEHDHYVVDCTIEVLGREQAIAVWQASVANLINQPLLKTFVSGMLAVFGGDRTRVVDLFPRAFDQIYRDFCEIKLVKTGGGGDLLFTDVAPQVWQHPGYLDTWQAAALGTLDVAGLEGTVALVEDATARSVQIHMRW